jgi:hypothetical protein
MSECTASHPPLPQSRHRTAKLPQAGPAVATPCRNARDNLDLGRFGCTPRRATFGGRAPRRPGSAEISACVLQVPTWRVRQIAPIARGRWKPPCFWKGASRCLFVACCDKSGNSAHSVVDRSPRPQSPGNRQTYRLRESSQEQETRLASLSARMAFLFQDSSARRVPQSPTHARFEINPQAYPARDVRTGGLLVFLTDLGPSDRDA